MSQNAAPAPSRWRTGIADVVSVLAFVAIGRASHDGGFSLSGLAATAWPFLTGLILGWLVFRVWRDPGALVWGGLGLWAVTVVVGLLLRLASGETAAPGFVVVTTVVLGLFLLGWRLLIVVIVRRRRRSV
jgi:hypothetical protein